MAGTDIRNKTEVWVALRRDGGDASAERVREAFNLLDELEAYLATQPINDERVAAGLKSLRVLREADASYVRYHIQGIATSREIAEAMCRDESYLIGPLPVNVVLQHDRTEWPGAYFPLRG